MSKKATLKDVAKEAGVSVATVSYILNNREDQKISEATRKKVLQIANLLDYTPNSIAKSLATGKNHLIGVVYDLNSSHYRISEIMDFIHCLQFRFHSSGYDLLVAPISLENASTPFCHNVDAIVAIDLPQDSFNRLSDNCFVPVIGIDMLINDALFFQIYSDLSTLVETAAKQANGKCVVVMDDYANERYNHYVHETIRYPIFHPNQLKTQCFDDCSLIVIGHSISRVVEQFHDPKIVIAQQPFISSKNTVFLSNGNEKKADKTVEITLNAIDKKFDGTHSHKIS